MTPSSQYAVYEGLTFLSDCQLGKSSSKGLTLVCTFAPSSILKFQQFQCLMYRLSHSLDSLVRESLSNCFLVILCFRRKKSVLLIAPFYLYIPSLSIRNRILVELLNLSLYFSPFMLFFFLTRSSTFPEFCYSFPFISLQLYT